jgi:uracil DNA glycosylase
MTLPTIHLNGTDATTLLRDAINAMDALRTAIEALDKTAPNGRDYYPQGGDALGLAFGEYLLRRDSLCNVLKELEQIAEYLSDKAVELNHF